MVLKKVVNLFRSGQYLDALCVLAFEWLWPTKFSRVFALLSFMTLVVAVTIFTKYGFLVPLTILAFIALMCVDARRNRH